MTSDPPLPKTTDTTYWGSVEALPIDGSNGFIVTHTYDPASKAEWAETGDRIRSFVDRQRGLRMTLDGEIMKWRRYKREMRKRAGAIIDGK